MMLLLDGVENILYGGAAGGGKSWVVLACALQYADVPGYAALILRKTYQDLSKPGGLLDVAKELLIPQGVHYDAQEKRFRFREGASLVFGHLENKDSHYQYAGQEYQCISIDESTQIPEHQLRFLHSRLRRLASSPCPIRYRLASNPGGISHDYHKRNYLEAPIRGERIYIPAKLEDNLYLDRENYTRQLQNLDPITRAQLLNGDWTARHAGMIFKREWFKVAEEIPEGLFGHWRAWDLAASESEAARYTAGVLMARDPDDNIYVVHVDRFKATPGERDRRIRSVAEEDGHEVRVFIPEDPGAGGITQAEFLSDYLIGFAVTCERMTGDKFTRAGPFASYAERGKVFIVRGPWNLPYLDELEAANPSEPEDNQILDQMDASSDAFRHVAEERPRNWAPRQERVLPRLEQLVNDGSQYAERSDADDMRAQGERREGYF